MNNRQYGERKRIAMVAHDMKKKELLDWAQRNKLVLAGHDLMATGTTGRLLEEQLGQPVKKFMSGPLGGDQQIGAMIATGEIDILIFFWDPMEAQPHDSDVKALLRLAIAWNCVVANDPSTADFIFTSPLLSQPYTSATPNYAAYLHRKIER
jgi:methylglyoxal synthase